MEHLPQAAVLGYALRVKFLVSIASAVLPGMWYHWFDISIQQPPRSNVYRSNFVLYMYGIPVSVYIARPCHVDPSRKNRAGRAWIKSVRDVPVRKMIF